MGKRVRGRTLMVTCPPSVSTTTTCRCAGKWEGGQWLKGSNATRRSRPAARPRSLLACPKVCTGHVLSTRWATLMVTCPPSVSTTTTCHSTQMEVSLVTSGNHSTQCFVFVVINERANTPPPDDAPGNGKWFRGGLVFKARKLCITQL